MSSTFTAIDAGQYEQMMGRWSRVLARQFIAFAGPGDGEAVIDVGCGTGSLTFELLSAAKHLTVTAVDYSPVYLAAARAHPAAKSVKFLEADATALPVADASFDRALSLLVLQFVPEATRAVDEMRRVVSPGGTVAAAVWDMRGGFLMQRLFWDAMARVVPSGEAGRARAYSRPLTGKGELIAAFNAAGLVNTVDTSLTIRMEYSCFDDLWRPIAGGEGPMGAYLLQLSPSEARPRRPPSSAPMKVARPMGHAASWPQLGPAGAASHDAHGH
jgi:ubiquinone/menaquinone biosynthesis C-methylase UbiE